jgi:hypothetical protein
MRRPANVETPPLRARLERPPSSPGRKAGVQPSMRGACMASCMWLFCLFANAQDTPGDAAWRRALMSLPDRPSPNTSVQDADQFSQNVELAVPYFATLTPGDYEANRELMRRLWTYQTELDLMASRNPQMRLAAGRARRALRALPVGLALAAGFAPAQAQDASQAPPAPPAPPAGPPFAQQAPAIENVPAVERSVADDLRSRYESSAARAAAAWENAEVLRQNLARQGMALSTQTAASVARLQLYFELAAGDLREHDWMEAAVNLERAEYETEKVFKTVGR